MVYIQLDEERKLPHHFDCACALYGAIDSCLDYRLTSFEEVASGKFDTLIKNHLFAGSTEFMTEVFKRAGKVNVRLPLNSNRKSEVITLLEAHRRVADGDSIFIKPVQIKLFTGLILDKMEHSCLTKLPWDTLVMAYEPFKSPILSEWRFYIHNHKIVDVRNYSGTFTDVPYFQYVESVIAQNKATFPVAYTIDVAILKDGTNCVVEFNDMWAIGNYGMPNDLYLRALKDRYFEIIINRF